MKGFFMFLGAGGFTLLLIAGAWWLATHVNIKKDNFSNDAEVDKYSKLPDTGLGEPQSIPPNGTVPFLNVAPSVYNGVGNTQ